MNPHQKNKVDISSLTPEEQKLFRMYGKLPNKKDLLQNKLKERKYFDSGDYALSKAGKASDVGVTQIGREHPNPETIPHLSTSPLNNGMNANSGNGHHHSGSMSSTASGSMSAGAAGGSFGGGSFTSGQGVGGPGQPGLFPPPMLSQQEQRQSLSSTSPERRPGQRWLQSETADTAEEEAVSDEATPSPPPGVTSVGAAGASAAGAPPAQVQNPSGLGGTAASAAVAAGDREVEGMPIRGGQS